jgi:SAM-dependent methyltransferase
LIFLNPRPSQTEMESAYQEEGYDPFQSLEKPKGIFDRAYRLARTYALAWKKRLVNKIVEPGAKILDGGCSTGEFLSVLKDQYVVEGFEPEPDAARWAGNRFGLTVHTGNLNTVSFQNDGFDLVTLWHVLEHIPELQPDVTRIHQLLRPGGKFLIAVPNVGSLDAKIYKENWIALDAPRHLWHFTLPSINSLASSTGFKIVRTGMLPLDTVYNVLLSEQLAIGTYGRIQLMKAIFRFPFAIIGSMIYGLFTGSHSSRYYILEKV